MVACREPKTRSAAEGSSPRAERCQHHCYLMRGGFQTIQGGVVPSTERGVASLITKRLDPLSMAMRAIVLFSSIGTGDVILLVSGKHGALTFTALFPAKAALNRLQIAVPKNRRSVLRAVVSAPPERNVARTCKRDRQSPPVR
jgi:hypothetical protein